MEIKNLKKYKVSEFYDYVIVKDKKLTWKCPICNTECRFLDQHLQRKHNITFKTYFKQNVNYSCIYCNQEKNLSELKWDRLKASPHSLNHEECIKNYKLSQRPSLTCEECGKIITGSGKIYCSYTCANNARYKDPLYKEKHRKSIINSYSLDLKESRAVSAVLGGFVKKGFISQGRECDYKGDDFYISKIKERYNITREVSSYLSKLKEINRTTTLKVGSSLEKLFLYELSKTNLNANYQHYLGRFIYDFYFPDYNLIVEIDGSHYHNNTSDKVKNSYAIKNGYNIVRISNIFDDCVNYCLNNENWINVKYTPITDDLVILEGKPKSSNGLNHWKFRSDITKEKVDDFLASNNKKTIINLLKHLNVTNRRVIQRIASSFYNLSYYEFVKVYLYESKIKEINKIK